MRANLKLFQLFSVLLFAVTVSATLLFHPSEVTRAEKRALSDTRGATSLMTNAQRMAVGLPPLPPRTRTSTAKRSGVSMVPVSNFIQVRDTGGGVRGYVSKGTGTFGRYFLNTGSLSNAATTSITVKQVGTTTQINLPNIQFGNIAGYIAGVITSGSADLSTSSGTFAVLGRSTSTSSPGSTPQSGAVTPLGTYESAIWTYDASTQEITAQWVTSDGSTPPTTIMYDPNASTAASFYLTASPNLVAQAHSSAYVVRFFLAAP